MTVAFAGNTGLKGLQGSAFRAGISLTKKAKYFPTPDGAPAPGNLLGQSLQGGLPTERLEAQSTTRLSEWNGKEAGKASSSGDGDPVTL